MKLFMFLLLMIPTLALTQKASESFVIWDGTPPGAKEGDDLVAIEARESIKNGSYKERQINCKGIKIPIVDVYMPPKEKQTGTAILLTCGGAYRFVCIKGEGLPITRWLNKNGITVFILSYRCAPYAHPVPFWDVQRAMRLIRHRSKDFNIKADQIGVMGFSAGGHLASTLSVNYKENFARKDLDLIDKVNARPDFSCFVYPVISMREGVTHLGSRKNLLGAIESEEMISKLSSNEQIDQYTPPAFLTHAKTDPLVNVINSKLYYEACIKNGIASKLVLHETGRHGPGQVEGKPSINSSTTGYADELIKWIEEVTRK